MIKRIHKRQARQERYETSKALFQCMMTQRTPVGAHVINIQSVGKARFFPLTNELAIDLTLQSLSDKIKLFIIKLQCD